MTIRPQRMSASALAMMSTRPSSARFHIGSPRAFMSFAASSFLGQGRFRSLNLKGQQFETTIDGLQEPRPDDPFSRGLSRTRIHVVQKRRALVEQVILQQVVPIQL